MIWQGHYNIEAKLNEAMDYFRKSTNNELYARAKYTYGCLLIFTGDFLEVREALTESYLNFKRCDNLEAAARVLNRLAFVQHHNGAIDDAISNIKKCIEINSHLEQPKKVIICRRNLVLVYCRTGALHDAEILFGSQNDIISKMNDNDKCQLYLAYSIVSALTGNLELAHSLISKTKIYLGSIKREKAIYYEYLGWIYNLDGRFEEAEKILKTVIELSMKIAPESALISQTKRLLADAYIGLEKFDKAQKTAEEALVVAEKINERVEIAGCYRVFAQVAVHQNKKEQAQEWYRKACETFALIQSKYELAATRYLMAVSGLYDSGERSALLYMSRDYFVSEDVKPFIKKVDKAIKGAPQPAMVSTEERNKHPFIAVHPKTKKIVELAENIAPADMTVLLTGPTGCGKDQLARYIHACSGRKGQFISINTAAIPDSMFESELFGYKKGAFTGADKDKAGLFELADNGTLYLNEIADSTPTFQAKLLEIIETKTIRRLGDDVSRKINIRIISATNHNLETRIRESKFRLDLYHRLNEIPIAIPPLSERKEDIPVLIKHFLQLSGCKIDSGKYEKELKSLGNILIKRDWSGNVRQLRGTLLHHGFIARGNLGILIELINEDNLENDSERKELIKALVATDWNQRETARLLGLTEGGVRYRINKYNLKKEDFIKTGA